MSAATATGGGVVIYDDSASSRRGSAAAARPPVTAAAAAASSCRPPVTAAGKILQKRWVCDVCKVKWFLDFEEACAHEATCNGGRGGAKNGASPPPPPPESSLISADSNDGSASGIAASSSRARGKGGGGESGGPSSTPAPSSAAAAVVAAARARVAKERDAKEPQQTRGGGSNKARAVEIVADDSSDGEGESNADADGKSKQKAKSLGHANDDAVECGGKSKKEAVTDDSKSLGHAPASSQVEASSSRADEIKSLEPRSLEQASKGASNDEITPGRRKSKRLREAASKPAPLQDRAVPHDDNTSNKSNGKKAKKGKSSKPSHKLAPKPSDKSSSKPSDKSSSKQSDKSSAKLDKPSKPPKKKASAKASIGGRFASIFLPKKTPKAAAGATESGSRKSSNAEEESANAKETSLPGCVSREEFEEHVVAERQATKRRKRAAKTGLAEEDELPGGVSREEYEEHVAAEKQAARRRKRAAAERKRTSGKRSKRSRARKREEESEDPESSSEGESDDLHESEDEEFSDKRPAKQKNFLSKKLVAEQQAADFFAKRKRAAAEERERQRKREELRLARLKEKNGARGGGEEGADAKTISNGGVLMSALVKTAGKCSVISHGRIAEGKKGKCVPAVRFPCPSHVVPYGDDTGDSELPCKVELNSAAKGASLQVLRTTPRHPHLKVDMSPSASDTNDATATTASLLQDIDQTTGLERKTAFDFLSSVFEQPAKDGKEEENGSSNDDNRLWADKYSMVSIPDDVLGEANKEASKKLLEFVEQWKVRRHKSVRRSPGRARRKYGRRRGRRRHGYDSDDSFLDDDDDAGGLEKIFLVTGPTGAGKTRLVRAAAEQMECAVVELNTAERRSGAALKRSIMETTQSHSSLAVSRRRRGGGGGGGEGGGGARDGNLFGSIAEEHEEEEDGGNESEDGDNDDGGCTESESDEESVKESSRSLTVILIDEVDLLFDEDAAFWPALAQVSRKAKCPIVLTATSVPRELIVGNNFRFRSARLDRPPPRECAAKLAAVSRAEGLRRRRDVGGPGEEEGLERLTLIAEACRRDVRRMLNEMQLLRFGESRRRPSGEADNGTVAESWWLRPRDRPPGASNDAAAAEEGPSILRVEPKVVRKDRHTLITVTGANFSPTAFPSRGSDVVEQTSLFIGGEPCSHFRVVGDDTIVAVCPPHASPWGAPEGAVRDDGSSGNVDRLTGKFLPLAARKKCSNGLVLDSSSRLGLEEDDVPANWNIEYDIPSRDDILERKKLSRAEFIRKSRQRLARENDVGVGVEGEGFLSSSDEEVEKKKRTAPDDEDGTQSTSDNVDTDPSEGDDVKAMEDTPSEQKPEEKDVDPQVMLDEAVAGMEACEEMPSTKESLLPGDHSSTLLEVNRFADELERLSDAILLEDSFTTLGIPGISGSVEGFGSHAIEPISTADSSADKLCKGKNKKPPSLETLYSTGANESGFFFGTSDCYVTRPIRQRDRRLLSYSGNNSRGLGFLDNLNCSSEESPEDSESGFDDENDEADSSSFVELQSRVRSEDDLLLDPRVSPAFLSLPSLLERGLRVGRKHGFTRDLTPLLHSRKNRVAANALGIMNAVVANCDKWYVGPIGLRHDTDSGTGHRPKLDRTLSTDYLPFLRAIARHENRARQLAEEVLKEEIDGGPPGRGGMRTRRSRRNIRRHYLDELAWGGGRDEEIEVKALELAENYMG